MNTIAIFKSSIIEAIDEKAERVNNGEPLGKKMRESYSRLAV